MNKDLERRYQELFSAYDMGGRGSLARVKTRLWESINRGLLRSDAAFLLLTLYDQMILRPYFGQFATQYGNIPPIVLKERAVDQSLEAVFGDLGSGQLPHSSHDVLKAIERTWQSQADFFNWE
jgi:hypothetical protein